VQKIFLKNPRLGIIGVLFAALGILCTAIALSFDASLLHLLKLPPGFDVRIYAYVPNAREMTLGRGGVVFVGSREAGKVFALVPNQNLTAAQKVVLIASNLNNPNGVAYHNGALYVAEIHRILRYDNIIQNLNRALVPTVIRDDLPTAAYHGWRYIKFGPDNRLYMAIGMPCNVCLPSDKRMGTIVRMNEDGGDLEIFAKGIRNSVGFAWQPKTRALWFTDNGRDWLGDNRPPDELNYAPSAGMNFGYPYYNGRTLDSEYGKLRDPQEKYVAPALELGPHVAALGMVFYDGRMFPKKYQDQILIAEHGSWNRTLKIGYRVTLVRLQGTHPYSYQPFITGWLQGQHEWGRPVDLLVMPDGALLISDDYAGIIYRVSYQEASR
jgi:glucose/arabinose dehydrogenase